MSMRGRRHVGGRGRLSTHPPWRGDAPSCRVGYDVSRRWPYQAVLALRVSECVDGEWEHCGTCSAEQIFPFYSLFWNVILCSRMDRYYIPAAIRSFACECGNLTKKSPKFDQTLRS